MVQCCSVVGCRANSRKNNEVRFYCFPSDKSPEIRKQWIAKLNRQYSDGTVWEPKYFHKVCSRHFKEGRPTPENPYPDQNLCPDGEDKMSLSDGNLDEGSDSSPNSSIAEVVPVTPRRRTKFAEPTTPKSESAEPKTTPEGKRKISPKSDSESRPRSRTSSCDSSGATPSKRLRSSDEGGSAKKTAEVTRIKKEPETEAGPGPAPEAGDENAASSRQSNRKRKRRVFNTPSDEEVIDNLVEEPETYVIWRRRQPTLTEADPEAEPEAHSSGYRMRSRRSVEEQPAQPAEVEPEVYPAGQRKRLIVTDDDGEEEEKDSFCWLCHKEGASLACELCPRGFHLKCLDIHKACPSWVCMECEKIMRAECVDTRSPAMALLTLEQLCVILKFALSQMRITGSEPFFHPVDKIALPLYDDFIANPTDFSNLEKNIRRKMYGSTEAFLADVRWLLHNSIVFNGSTHKLTTHARAIVRICKTEISDIEGCPDCYMNAWIKQDKNWFVEPCRIPHTLVWAKLKGYPFWPGKALNEEGGQIDVRFFGAHDRAWVPTTNVLMLSREAPFDLKNKRLGIEKAMDELTIHIKKLEQKFGSFKYSALNVPYDPHISYGFIVKGEVLNKDDDPNGKPEVESTKSETTTPGEENKASKDDENYLKDISVGEGLSLSEDTDSIMSSTQSFKNNTPLEGSKDTRFGGERAMLDEHSINTPPLSEHLSNNESDYNKPLTSPHSPKPQTSAISLREEDSRLSGLTLIERLELKMLEAEREEAELQAKETAEKERAEAEKTREEGDGMSEGKNGEKDGKNGEKDRKNGKKDEDESKKVSSGQVRGSAAETEELTLRLSDEESEIDLAKVSLIGTPKKNPMLDNLVNSCKAQLGIENDEELKLETSPSQETEDGEEGTSTSSPRTVSSLHTRQDEEEVGEDEEEEQQDSSDSGDSEEEGDEEEESDEEKTESLTEERKKEEKAKKKTSQGEAQVKKDSDTKNTEGTETSAITNSSEKPDNEETTHLDKQVIEQKNENEKTSLIENTREDVVLTADSGRADLVTAADSTATTPDPTADPDSGGMALEILHSQSISSDAFEAASKTLDDEMLENKEQDRPRKKKPRTKKHHLPPSLVVDESTDTDMENETSPKSCDKNEKIDVKIYPQRRDVSEERNNSVGSDVFFEKNQTLDSVNRTRSSTPSSDMSGTHKNFRSRLMEELVKTGPPKTAVEDMLSTGVGGMHQIEFFGDDGDRLVLGTSQGFQKSKGEVGDQAPTPGVSQMRVGEEEMEGVGKMDSFQDRRWRDGEGSEGVGSGCEAGDVPMNVGMSDAPLTHNASSPPPPQEEGSSSAVSGLSVDKYVSKAVSSLQSIFQEMLGDFMSSDLGQASVKQVREEMERMKWYHQQQVLEVQHNAQLITAEMRLMLEHEHSCKMKKLVQLHEEEREKTVEEVKKKQWCSSCGKEANFYCCWNTSYCDYPCQQKHWTKHMPYCMQTQSNQPPVGLQPHSLIQDNSTATPTVMVTNNSTIPTASVTDWDNSQTDSKKRRRRRGEASKPPYVPQAGQSNAPGVVSKSKPTSLTVGKTLKMGNTTGGMATVHYLSNQMSGGSADEGPPRTVISGQTSSSGGPVPLMYQFVPRYPQTAPQNIRLTAPQTIPPRPPTAPLNFHPSQT